MTKRKNTRNSEDRNFFRFMTFIGVMTIGSIVYAFLDAAPELSSIEQHKNSKQPDDCLNCHVHQAEKVPIMPHRPMQTCIACHNKIS